MFAAACGRDEGPKYGQSAEAVTQCPSATVVQGIDVSHYDGTIDWSTVATTDVKFAYAKATQSTDYKDSQFAANWSGMKAHGILRGAYHFLDTTPGVSGTSQADYYLAEVASAGGFATGDLPPMLDWELQASGTTVSDATTNAQEFIAEIKLKTGMPTIIYTYPDYWNNTLGNPSGFTSDSLWVANYGVTCPELLAPWTSWVIWQYSATGTVNGVTGGSSGMVDLDEFNGTLSQLQMIAGGTPPPTFAPPAQVTGNDAITVTNWPDEHVEIFAKTPSGSVLHSATSGMGDTWNAPSSLGTGAACGSSAAFWGPSSSAPELFSPLLSGASGYLSWSSAGGWAPVTDFGGSVTGLSRFATTVGNDGRVWVFALGADKAIWVQSWNAGASAWRGWTSLGGTFATGVGPITWGNGTLEIFATDTSGMVWHMWLIAGTTAWSAWTQISGGMASRPVPVRWNDGKDGHAEVFVRGADNQLYVSNYDYTLAAGYPTFSVVSAGSTIHGDPSAIMTPSGNPEVFARGANGQVLGTLWNGSSFPTLAVINPGTVASDPFGWTRGDGHAEVFAIDASGDLMRTYDDPSGGWTAWSTIGSGFDPCVDDTPTSDVDAGMPTVDGGTPKTDAGMQKEDAGNVVPAGGHDAGMESDAGTSAREESDGGGGAGKTPDAGRVAGASGCNCSSGPVEPALGIVYLLGAMVLRRKRRSTGL
jgi:lysozyme